MDSDIEQLYRTKMDADYEIDAYIRHMGIANPERITDEDGWRYLRRGSALISIGTVVLDSSVALNAHCKIMDLPSDKDIILPLMRELLEMNATLPNEARFAISNNSVIISVVKMIISDCENLIPLCLDIISYFADEYDDYLIEKYGGTSRSRASIR